MQWKIMIFESQNHFANISATIARVFMKFETEAHKIVMNYQNNFHENPCIHTQAICMVMKIVSVFHYYFMSLSFKFPKGWSFRYGNICKMVMTLKIIKFYFWYFHSYTPQQIWIITEWFWHFLETRYQGSLWSPLPQVRAYAIYEHSPN